MNEAERHRQHCAGILILSENQADWAARFAHSPRVGILVRPVTLNQLYTKLCELLRGG